MSFGTDRAYRRRSLKLAGLKPGMRVLDVATGTGLVAQAALSVGIRRADLVGLDPSPGMLAENGKRNGIQLIQGLGERLPIRDATFDFIVMGYALRHVEDLNRLANAPDWVLTTARAINDRGQIVGTGSLRGDPHGFLLNPR